jgi:hypothetical protein
VVSVSFSRCGCGCGWQGWHEEAISFAPTYKFIAGTSAYDRRPHKKKRFPAWCDRILSKGEDVRQVRAGEVVVAAC